MSWSQRKTGRRVSHIGFQFARKATEEQVEFEFGGGNTNAKRKRVPGSNDKRETRKKITAAIMDISDTDW